MPIYDFKCINKDCKVYNQTQEMLLKVGKVPSCDLCNTTMQKLFLPPDGKRNPHPSWSTWRVGIGLKD